MKFLRQPLILINLAILILAVAVCFVKLAEINKIQHALSNNEKIVTKEYWVQMPVKGHVGSLFVEFEMTHLESFNPLEQLKEVQFELGKYSYLHTADDLQDSTITAIINQLQNDYRILNVQITKINK